jgi:hypothetical protein
MVIRVLNAYLRRITEAGGTSIVAYTEGIINPNTENMLKSLFDNTIKLDGQNIQIKSHFEEEEELINYKSTYKITNKGIVVKKE